jgi:hypothetical protein
MCATLMYATKARGWYYAEFFRETLHAELELCGRERYLTRGGGEYTPRRIGQSSDIGAG